MSAPVYVSGDVDAIAAALREQGEAAATQALVWIRAIHESAVTPALKGKRTVAVLAAWEIACPAPDGRSAAFAAAWTPKPVDEPEPAVDEPAGVFPPVAHVRFIGHRLDELRSAVKIARDDVQAAGLRAVLGRMVTQLDDVVDQLVDAQELAGASP